MVLWQNGYMHPDEYREDRLVRFHGVPQKVRKKDDNWHLVQVSDTTMAP